jgi:hypothetical protein
MDIIKLLCMNNYNQYSNDCFHGLEIPINILDIDYSKGETDLVRILFVEKKHLTKYHAISILTMRLLMYEEGWNKYEFYTIKDVEYWIEILEKKYSKSNFLISNFDLKQDSGYYFIQRLEDNDAINSILFNTEIIEFNDFFMINPLFSEKIIRANTSKFEGLETEYYIETENHFVLFNWYTTA